MSRPRPASLPQPPYYAVVFTSVRPAADEPAGDGYAEAAAELFTMVQGQPGFLGADSTRGSNGLGITVAYFRDEESIAGWRAHPDHAAARRLGRQRWYDSFAIHVAKVERAYRFDR
jgi:heme-degrading monooxygenase HmoA